MHYGDTTTLSVPSSARVGVPISITVTSFGGGCIGPGETEVTFQDSGAEIRPHRYETVRLPPDMGCTRELRVFQHTATLQFAQAGEARVRIVGLARPGDAPFVVE
ncbi:MAG: hypothetical protein Q7S58_19640, partial [Candidatus Binatus sp.]|nr:hypothetical protein [Candidatus Binatus sp.]